MRLCDFYKIHSFLADLLYSNIDLSSSGHKLTKFHDLVKKNEVEKKSDFPHFFSNSAVSWLWGTPTVTKLKTKGPHGQKHVLSCSKNSTRKFQLVCWNFDFCILGRFLQIRPSVKWNGWNCQIGPNWPRNGLEAGKQWPPPGPSWREGAGESK